MKFKIGDKVRVIVTDAEATDAKIGDVGTVKVINIGKRLCYGVEFDKPYFRYHSLGGRCKENHGYWCSENMLESVKNKPIVIYNVGLKVIAKDHNTGKTGVARCNPIDKFDFYTGAKLAFDRLTGEEKKKLKFAPDMAIWCENKSQFDGLMNILEVNGYKWKYGTAPTKYTPSCVHDGVIICPNADKSISYCDRSKSFNNKVNFSDVDFSECAQKIKVGDMVKIADTGKMYPTHYEWVKEYVPNLAVYYAYGDTAGYHDGIKHASGKFKVVHIAEGKAYVMSNARGDRKCYLVGLEGLAKC